MPSEPEIFLTWEAPEYKHYPKNFGWYVTFFAIAILLIGFLAISKDYFGAISLFILALIAFLYTKHRPEVLQIAISDKGVHLDDLHIPHSDIKHFWVVDNERHKTLILETNVYLNKTIVLELVDQDPDAVRGVLGLFAREHENTQETLAQKVMHRFKF